MKKFLLLCVALCVAASSWAYSFKSEGVFYNIISSSSPSTVEVTDSTTAYGGSYSGSVTIPSQVTYGGNNYTVISIGEKAFDQCIGLTSVSLPSTITTIGSYAFAYCYGLTSIAIPTSVTSFGDGIFEGSSALTSINLPAGLTTIGTANFWYCSKLTEITVDAANSAYVSVDGVLFNKAQTKLMCYPAGKTGSSYTIPSTVTAIDSNAFGDCTNLSAITIPTSVTSIGDAAFYACSALVSIAIPSSVSFIGSGCFGYCSSMENIYANATTPVSLSDKYVFEEVDTTTCVLHVPSGSLSAYQNADVWKSFKHITDDLTTGINNATAHAVKVSVVDGMLMLSGVDADQRIAVYSASGTLVYSGKTTTETIRIALSQHGVYIVQVGNRSMKTVY